MQPSPLHTLVLQKDRGKGKEVGKEAGKGKERGKGKEMEKGKEREKGMDMGRNVGWKKNGVCLGEAAARGAWGEVGAPSVPSVH